MMSSVARQSPTARLEAAATDAESGTLIIRSTTPGRNDGSTRGRPMPSIREDAPVTTSVPHSKDWKNAEFSGSTTHNLVS